MHADFLAECVLFFYLEDGAGFADAEALRVEIGRS
jgi:hypothetical protein